MSEYIEREEIRRAYEKLTRSYVNGNPYIADWRFDEMIEKLPAADVAPVRHSKWGVEVGMNFYKERNCPVCKKRIESNFWSYCPNCGAKMDGGAIDGDVQ